MRIREVGAIWALIYSFLPMLATWLGDSAEQGIVNGVVAAVAITIIQAAMRMIDIFRSEGMPVVEGATAAYTVGPQNRRGRIHRVLLGE